MTHRRAGVASVGSACVALLAAATPFVRAQRALTAPARYLFTWVGDEDRQDSDFLAVVDLAHDGDRYGTIVATVPVGERGLWPHHTEHELGPSGRLFANGFAGNPQFSVRRP
jgi:hypothetical protein